MKKEKDKSKKGHESTIGKIIYGFLLFLPLFAIGTTCLISTFNMSSKEQAEVVYKYETNEVNSVDDLKVGNIYHYVNDFSSLSIGTEFAECLAIYNVKALRQTIDTFYNVNTTLKLQKLSESNFDIFATNPTNRIGRIYVENNILECDIVYSNLFGNDVYTNYSICENNIFDYVETHNLDAEKVFYNSIDKVQQSPLFNWTTNSLLYTGMNEFTTSLSITTPFIPLLLTYWLIISVVYFLYDIVLVILTVLHRKIHNLQDSI